jgi:hypothetical protein
MMFFINNFKLCFFLFQGLIISAAEVSTPFSFETCLTRTSTTDGVRYCSTYGTEEAYSAPLVPPFIYSGQCGTVLLTRYIPVFLFGYSIQLVLTVIVLIGQAYPHFGSSLWILFGKSIWGIFVPHKVRKPNNYDDGVDPFGILDTRTIFCNDILNNLLVFLTFGMCSPVLLIAVVSCVFLKMGLWQLLVGRFTQFFLTSESEFDNVSYALNSLAAGFTPILDVLEASFWWLLWCSALFVALIGWDMASDDAGWRATIWVAMLPLGYCGLLRLLAFFYLNYYQQQTQRCSISASVYSDHDCEQIGSTIELRESSLSPLHIHNVGEL